VENLHDRLRACVGGGNDKKDFLLIISVQSVSFFNQFSYLEIFLFYRFCILEIKYYIQFFFINASSHIL
jgi:hypothetical protein